ncbi:gastrula zinc finger protein XlCGF71.1-like [Pollicipes pollicipes]|uniref:gastrula zinc finger protein XlCGF71.1-like n=1 Tax=Pollicipes pollicipes TaxID=41117 RepID=UPI001884D937|nr:gastrula zinc finger protein XlCGF71.1-like [Pollicipes pollicipes]
MHLWRAHRIDCDLYHCDLCDYKTTRYSQLVSQHLPTHSQLREHVCETCQKAFKSSKQLQNHRAKHKRRDDPSFVESCRCPLCGLVLSDRRALQLHREMVHEKRRGFQCNTCGRLFSCRSSLVMHARQHTGQKPFACEQCDYATTDHNTLRRHRMRHTGERPYKCPHCSYSCIQSTTYKKHLRTKHPNAAADLVFSCQHCIFKTIQRSAYTRHMQEHDDRPAPAPAPASAPAAACNSCI